MVLNEFPLWFLRLTAVCFGLIWGSFLNVVIYRVPRDMNVAKPASHCPACKAPVKPYDNIPVLSYLLLRGRARCCGAKMSPRYVLVELIGGMVSLAILEALVRPLASSTPIGQASAVYLAYFMVSMGLVAAAFIDLEHMYIPDTISMGGALLGVVTATIRGESLTASVLGGAVAVNILWLPLNAVYRVLRGRTGLGWGDGKLLVLFGTFAGWQGAVFSLLSASVTAVLFTLALEITGNTLKLPAAVREELDKLKQAASEGDTEAAQILAEDPLAGDSAEGAFRQPLAFGGVFLVLLGLLTGPRAPSFRFVAGLFGFTLLFVGLGKVMKRPFAPPVDTGGASEEVDSAEGADVPDRDDGSVMQRSLPLGPFLILGFLTYIFGLNHLLRSYIGLSLPIF